ncbi:MAG: DNA alkylation repair protein [bacterium]|nr:DNA alkylation repair protein [bacterium]
MPDKPTSIQSILAILHSMESEENRSGMARFGINIDNALSIKVTDLRKLARQVEKSHDLALQLWETGIHEARLLATMIDEPSAVTGQQMENWALRAIGKKIRPSGVRP